MDPAGEAGQHQARSLSPENCFLQDIMAQTLTLFDPTAPRRGDTPSAASRPALSALAGTTVGFIDNAKPNFQYLVDDLAELLQSRYGVARVIKSRKSSASLPADPAVIEALSGECDVVIAGSGD